MKLSVIIPVYNEKDTVARIFDTVNEVSDIDKELIIIDDASTDGTVDVLKTLEKKYPDARFIYKKKNYGKGHTVALGLRESMGDYVIIQDADLEYDPHDYLKLLEEVKSPDVDVVYGSRFSGNYQDMSNLHYFGNKLLTLITNVFFGVMLTDMET